MSVLKTIEPYLPPILTDFLNKITLKPRENSKRPPFARKTDRKATSKSLVTAATMTPSRWSAIVLSFILAGIGQYYWMQSSVPSTLAIGFIPFTLAVVFFLYALKPWQREGLTRAPLDRVWEWCFFSLIMFVAAFFRLDRLAELPNGFFMDQGNAGLAALRILHDHFRPVFEFEEFQHPALLLYQLAAWFTVMPATKYGFDLFFALMGLATFPLAYWTLRQLSGPRTALLALFVFSVMRWHFNFCRNGFPTVQVPFYMFGTLSFLLYGLNTQRRRWFAVSAVFFSMGLYTYNAIKLFPLLVITLGVYEFMADRERFRKNLKNIATFSLITVVLISPLLYRWTVFGPGNREATNSLLSDVKSQHSMKPVWRMITKTALMGNREGDDNERHNLANHRMLDDVSASLFVLGVFYALSRWKRRKYFYALAGLFIMSLPGLLSVVPAHANRMLGVSVFVAFLVAIPLAAVWARMRAAWGAIGEFLFLLLLVEPLLVMGYQNYHVYFVEQASNNTYWETSFWGGYSIDAYQTGNAISHDGNLYDYIMFSRLSTHPTVNFLGYKYRDHIRTLKLPEGLVPLQTTDGRGLCFALLSEHEGYLKTLQNLYPEGKREDFKDLNGHVYLYLYRVSAEEVAKVKGLTGTFSPGGEKIVGSFPNQLPSGPYRTVLHGSVMIPATGVYHVQFHSNAVVSARIGENPTAGFLSLLRGFYPVTIDLQAPAGTVDLKVSLVSKKGSVTDLSSDSWTSLRIGGLESTYYPVNGWKGEPSLVQLDPMINFVNGTDFPYTNWQESVRWKGTLLAPTSGEYNFMAVTEEKVGLTLDGKKVIGWNQNPRVGKIYLTQGAHFLQMDFEKILGPTLSLSWKEPGGSSMSPIPNSAFGVPRAVSGQP